MAQTKHTVRNTRNEAKILAAADGAETVTIALADLAAEDEYFSSGDAKVNVSTVEGAASGEIIITRDGAPIFACGTGSWGVFDLGNCDVNNTTAVVVSFTGPGSVVVGLRKVDGYGWVGINGPEGPQEP